MQRFKHLGVFLHDSPADPAALSFAAKFAALAGSEAMLAVHVREADTDEPEPEEAALRRTIVGALPEAVARVTEVEVHRGTGVAEILRAARDRALDLIVVGRRLPSEQLGIGLACARLARKSPCSVLVVPAFAHPHFDRVHVPVDFSDHSKRALETAIAIARASGESQSQLVVHSNFHVGYGYAKLGMTLQQAIEDRQQKVQQQLRDFIAEFELSDFDVEAVATSSTELERTIQEVAVARKMDLIVVGSRGTTAALLLGATAERILMHSLLPVLIVKRKGETAHILDALLGGD